MSKIVLLAGEGLSSWVVYNRLRAEFESVEVIVENGVPATTFFQRRIRKLGLLQVMSQLAFMIVVSPCLKVLSKSRIREIAKQHGLDFTPPTEIQRIESVNSEDARAAILKAKPDVVVVNGTRIISEKTLSCTDSLFINIHAGITPAYRGSHGGYWALYEGRPDKCGATVHLVDNGIDTGKIISQAIIFPQHKDNFATYPLLQLGVALPLLVNAVRAALRNELVVVAVTGTSKIWYHPGVIQYVKGRLQGVR